MSESASLIVGGNAVRDLANVADVVGGCLVSKAAAPAGEGFVDIAAGATFVWVCCSLKVWTVGSLDSFGFVAICLYQPHPKASTARNVMACPRFDLSNIGTPK